MKENPNTIAFAKAMGLKTEEIDKFVDNTIKFADTFPRFQVPKDGNKVYASFDTDDVKTDIDTDYGKSNTTVVVDDNGVKYTFWIKPGSMAAREYMRQRLLCGKAEGNPESIGSIKGKRYAFWTDPIQTKKFGEQHALRMQICPKVDAVTNSAASTNA